MISPIEKPDKKGLRSFGLITGAIVIGLFGLLLPWLFGHGYPKWPWVIAGILWVWALVLPASLWPVYRGWLTIGNLLGWINTRIILGLMFYVILMPIGLIMKLLRKDPLARSFDKAVDSYRTPSRIPDKNHLERPF